MTTYLFRPPARSGGARVTRDSTSVQRRLFVHFPTVGVPVTVLIKGGVVTESLSPRVDDINAADTVCWGGGENVLTQGDAYLLADAGYEVLADGVPLPRGGGHFPSSSLFPSASTYPGS